MFFGHSVIKLEINNKRIFFLKIKWVQDYNIFTNSYEGYSQNNHWEIF